MILDHYGTRSAITALEQVPPGDAAIQTACIEKLIRHLHAQLAFSIRADLVQRGETVPGETWFISWLPGSRNDLLYKLELRDRRQPAHDEEFCLEPPFVTTTGASCQTPLPCCTQ